MFSRDISRKSKIPKCDWKLSMHPLNFKWQCPRMSCIPALRLTIAKMGSSTSSRNDVLLLAFAWRRVKWPQIFGHWLATGTYLDSRGAAWFCHLRSQACKGYIYPVSLWRLYQEWIPIYHFCLATTVETTLRTNSCMDSGNSWSHIFDILSPS